MPTNVARAYQAVASVQNSAQKLLKDAVSLPAWPGAKPAARPSATHEAKPSPMLAVRAMPRGRLSKLVDTAVKQPEPTICNLQITSAHHELAKGLGEWLGADAGANFHTWAVWGSKKAGQTIRREDLNGFGPLSAAANRIAAPVHKRSAEAILGGNITVLDDIGRVTARFLESVPPTSKPDEAALEQFLGTLQPGAAGQGGQDLLRAAFKNYYHARFATNLKEKHELVLLGNCLILLHEHHRLDSYISKAMPPLARRMLTKHMLAFTIGSTRYNPSRDLPPSNGRTFPPTLETIENPELRALLAEWDPTPDSLRDSGAKDWSDIRERMHYGFDLFRSRHSSEEVAKPPYDVWDLELIRSGFVPWGR